jgi:predicted dehydrogenase
MSKRFRAGMLGTGPLCELHVAAVKALADVELVGVSEKLEELLDAGANVIHVLTPPATHARFAKAALETGCHVVIEKPVTQDEKEALEIGRLAQRKGLMATVSHALLYDPQVKRAIEAARSGALGDLVSVDIARSLEYPPYEGGPLPPWYRDAGFAFRDVGVECLYLIQEVLGPIEDVDASWRSLGGGDPNLAFDEWRAMVRCKRGLGQVQLTYNTRPVQSQMIINGTKSAVRVDLGSPIHGKRSSTPLPKAAERLLSAFGLVRREALPFQGLHDLVADFYRRLDA